MQKNGSEIMEFKKGIKDSIPVGLGYFAVSFSLGIIAKNVGLSPIQGFLASLFINASAGEYAVFLMISTHGTFIQMVIMTLVSNARYFLMSFALSQKIEEKTNLLHRMCIGFDLTDELFGLAINHEVKVNHKYIYGTYLVALPCWALGTALGIVAGNSLPTKIVASLSVALYGMFLAIIIPQAKKDRVIGLLIIISFLLSYICKDVPISGGTRTILLTIIISMAAAIIKPRKKEENV